MSDPDAIRYLRIAQADLAEAQRMVELTGFRDSSIGFLLQQACEKALKSWIHANGGLAPFTHDLVALMDWLDESGADVIAGDLNTRPRKRYGFRTPSKMYYAS
ncbi:MAG: HEPN domain-containing protein [Cyanobacteriota bacterium]|jgi:HEPN domain-containing protein